MYYYKKETDEIVKYQIILDENKLNELRSEIIERCSLITHECYKTTKTPDYFDYEHIRNYREKKIGVIEYNDFYSTSEDEYLVEYDYYKHPRLVTIIEELLKGNSVVINDLINPNIEDINEEKILLKEQQKLIKKLNNSKNISKQIELLTQNQQKLLDYKKQKQLNKNQISVKSYYEKVLGCISMKKINSISMEIVNEYVEFFRETSEINIDNEVKKVLNKKKEKLF